MNREQVLAEIGRGKKIWKFKLAVRDEQIVFMPEGAYVLCVQVQGQIPCLWALVDPSLKEVERRFRTVGTGHPAENMGTYIGTYQISGGALVFHVFGD